MTTTPTPSRFRRLLSLLSLRAPFWKRSGWHRCGRLGVWCLYWYVGVLIVLVWLENWFLYHPTPATEDWAPPPPGLTVEDVPLSSADGTALHGWWAKPTHWQPEQGALLYFHGNAGNLSHRGDLVKMWRDRLQVAVLIIDYPGFGKSGGKPNEASCYLAGDAAYDWVTKVAGVPPERLILYGISLGGAIATDLAVRRPHRALVLLSAFTSFPDMAQKTFPWLPGRWLVRNKLDNLKKITTLHTPVFIAHGTLDGLIPFRQGERLFAAANEPKQFFRLEGHGHDESPGSGFYTALAQFLEQTENTGR